MFPGNYQAHVVVHSAILGWNVEEVVLCSSANLTWIEERVIHTLFSNSVITSVDNWWINYE